MAYFGARATNRAGGGDGSAFCQLLYKFFLWNLSEQSEPSSLGRLGTLSDVETSGEPLWIRLGRDAAPYLTIKIFLVKWYHRW